MLDDKTLARLDALALRLKNRTRGAAGGARRSSALGSSAEFSDFREYVPGDDVRRVDWNAYARFERLFLKLFMEEQEAEITLLVDASRSMKAKWETCLVCAEMLGYLALTGGDRLRVVLLRGRAASDGGRFAGKKDFLHMERFLEAGEPSGETDLDGAVPALSLGTHGLTILISDLFSDSGYERALSSLLFRKQEVIVLHVLAEEEVEPRFEGAVRLTDSENARYLDLMAGGEVLREYQKALDAFRKALRGFCHKRGVELIELTAGEKASGEMLRRLMTAGSVQ